MANAKRKRKKDNHLVEKVVSVVVILINFFALTKLGLVGESAFNLISLFFGRLTILVTIITIIFSGWYLFTNELLFAKKKKRLIGGTIIILSVLTLLHAAFFSNIINPETKVITATCRFWWYDVQSSTASQGIGGGLIGGLIYALSYILFDQLGTYIVAGVLAFIGALFTFDISFNIVIRVITNAASRTYHAIKRLFSGDKGSSKKKTKKTKTKEIDHTVSEKRNQADSLQNIPTEKGEQPTEKQSAHKKQTIIHTADEPVEQKEEPIEQLSFEEVDDNDDYSLPSVDILNAYQPNNQSKEKELTERNQQKLQETFESFGVEADVVDITLGPAVTKYAIKPETGVKVSKIVALQNDIALALAAKDIRIEAPIPGQALVGIEVPNQDVSFVSFKEVMAKTSRHPNKLLDLPIGKSIDGDVVTADLSKMPHLLIAGATGSGKSVGINGIITAILMRTKPNEVKLMLVDPKKVELSVYNGVPHLLTPVVTDPKKAARALNNVVKEMERRYELFAQTGSRNRDGYNQYVIKHNQETGENLPRLPYIVVVVDELADLMMVASKEVEDAIMRLAQMARAAGIHMVLATQRPSVDVLTGTIKANIPSRIAFSVTSGTDSRTILDTTGAEKLIGKGDMLFLPMGQNQPLRVQGSFISDEEVERVVNFVKGQQSENYVEAMMPSDKAETDKQEAPEDELFSDVVDFITKEEKCSISLLQRHFRIGYNRAARLVDDLEARGYVGEQNGSKPREVYLKTEDNPKEEQEVENHPSGH